MLDDFLATLVPKEDLQDARKEARQNQKVSNELNALKYILEQGSLYWSRVLEYGVQRKMVSPMEHDALKAAVDIERTGRTPPAKQANLIIKCRERLVQEGMPMQF